MNEPFPHISERGEERDLSLQEEDVIDLSASAPKLVAYSLCRIFIAIVHVGASIPLVK